MAETYLEMYSRGLDSMIGVPANMLGCTGFRMVPQGSRVAANVEALTDAGFSTTELVVMLGIAIDRLAGLALDGAYSEADDA